MNVKKILILGTQSSGGTLFTQMLASRLNCISILDLRSGSAGLTSEDIDSENMPWLVKVVITKKVPPNQHIRSFNPDKVISIIRHPEKILRSLDRKFYGYRFGSPIEKLILMDDLLKTGLSDIVIRYEDFTNETFDWNSLIEQLGLCDYLHNEPQIRTLSQIISFTTEHSAWAESALKKFEWGSGSIRSEFQDTKTVILNRENIHPHINIKYTDIISLLPQHAKYYRCKSAIYDQNLYRTRKSLIRRDVYKVFWFNIVGGLNFIRERLLGKRFP